MASGNGPPVTAGRFFVAGFEGTTPSEEILALIRDFGLGGVILYGKNCSSPPQVAELTRSLQDASRRAGREDPLFIAIDQEQGRVARIRRGVTHFPAMAELGKLKDVGIVRRVARAVSRELLALGINWNLAPVADVSVARGCHIGDRSFGSHAGAAAARVRSFVEGAEEEGMISCLKHFPGHGGVTEDSHVASPVDVREGAGIAARDLLPFREGIAAGAPAVMTAHVTFPAFDAGAPATFSPAIIGGLLRRELAFEGLVVSDDLEMTGAAGRFTLAEASLRALTAGVDLLIVSGMLLPERDLPGLIEEVSRRIAAGEVPEKRVGEAAENVARLKSRYLAGGLEPTPVGSTDLLRCREHLDLLAEIRELLRDPSVT